MQKKIHLLLLLCMAFFMVCATVEMSARTVVPHSVLTEQDGTHQGDGSFFMPESPFFFFARISLALSMYLSKQAVYCIRYPYIFEV